MMRDGKIMTDKDVNQIWLIVFLVAGICGGLAIGMTITSLRYDSEIRTDQVELKEQVAEIVEDESIIEDIVKTLLFQVEQLKKERQELRELKILLSMDSKK